MKKKTSPGNRPKRVAIIGSQGVPPQYGGFETLVDNILTYRNPEKVEYTVFCSKPDMKTDLSTYKECRLRYVNLHAHGKMSVPYDIMSMIKGIRGYDVILVLGVSGCVFLPMMKLLTRAKIIVNVDGLEHKRDKWEKTAKYFLKKSLDVCVRWADEIVSDNKGIKDYIKDIYNREAKLIAYGGDHAIRDIDAKRQHAILEFYRLAGRPYDLSICRIEPENNVEMTLEAYRQIRERNIVIIGNWDHSDYSRNIFIRYSHDDNITMLPPIYDLDILYVLRNNADIYVHGHRAGGTNPSLVEAMFFGKPILAFDVIYNRETTQGKAYYYQDLSSLTDILKSKDLTGLETEKIARKQYIWHEISRQYEALY